MEEKQKTEEQVLSREYKTSEEIFTEIARLASKIRLDPTGQYKDKLQNLHKAIEEHYKKSVEMEKNPFVKKVLEFFTELGINVVSPLNYVKKSKLELQGALSEYDKIIRKLEYDKNTIEREIEELQDTRDLAIEVRHKLKEGIERAGFELDELVKKYREGGEDKPTSRDIRKKKDLLRKFNSDLRQYGLTIKNYQLRIDSLKNSVGELEMQLQLADLLRLNTYTILTENVPKVDTKGNRIKIAEIKLKAEPREENFVRVVNIYNREDQGLELLALKDMLPRTASESSNDLDYRAIEREAETKAISEEIKKKTEALDREIDSLEDKIRKDPLY